eukprot:SAG11_NODE_1537_length_4724_cov_4.318270_12_plen_32_part_00
MRGAKTAREQATFLPTIRGPKVSDHGALTTR